MDVGGLKELKRSKPELIKDRSLSYFLAQMEEYAKSREAFGLEIHGEDEFKKVVQFLGFENIENERLLAGGVVNTITELEEIRKQAECRLPLIEGVVEVDELLELIADSQDIWADNPNDFRATMILDLDGETAVVLGKQCEEIAIVCRECSNSGEYDRNGEHSCDHHIEDYDYDQKYFVGALDKSQVKNHPNVFYWDMRYIDVDTEEAERERREIEYEEREGIANLARLAVGDSVNMEFKDGAKVRFKVMKPGRRPLGYTSVVNAAGVEFKPFRAHIDGAGRWTNRRQNPVQDQDIALTVSEWGQLYKAGGQRVLFSPPDGLPFGRDIYVMNEDTTSVKVETKT